LGKNINYEMILGLIFGKFCLLPSTQSTVLQSSLVRLMVYLKDKKDWVQFEVITEIGLSLGWVKNVSIDCESKNLISLVIAPASIRWLPEKLASSYELAGEYIISIRSKRIIVFEGSEKHLNYLKIGMLERLKIITPRWLEKENFPIVFSTSLKRDEDDEAGFYSAINPRKPSPKPTDNAVEILSDQRDL
jgi:sporulation protein YlmC with PRC-barrel domain